MLARCRYGARRLFYVGILVLAEVEHGDVPCLPDLIARDEVTRRERVEEVVNVDIIVGKYLGLDPLRPVLKSPLAVGEAP